MSDAHAAVIATVFIEFCRGDLEEIYAAAVVAAAAASAITFARTVAITQAACASSDKAFNCASATALAEAWASATAEAHATAVAASAEECECLAKSQELSGGKASTFITLATDTFARDEVTMCSEGDAASFAAAYADCSALAYATVWTTAFLEGYCFSSKVATRIFAETSGTFGVIQGCDRDDFSFGDAFGSTDGSTAEGVRSSEHCTPVCRDHSCQKPVAPSCRYVMPRCLKACRLIYVGA